MESFKNKTNRTLCTILLVYLFVYKCKPSHGFKLGLHYTVCLQTPPHYTVCLQTHLKKPEYSGSECYTSGQTKEEYPAWKSSECHTSGQTKEEYPVWKSSTSPPVNTEDLRDNQTKEEYHAWKSSTSTNLSVENNEDSRDKQKPSISKKRINFPFSLETNFFWRMLNGNGRSLNISAWNCRRGLLDKDNEATEKLLEIEQYIEENKLHALCIIESDLHSATSRVKRNNPANTETIHARLRIEGFSIILPDTWDSHGQARIMLYIKEDVRYEIIRNPRDCNDLPSISCKLGIGKEKVFVNFFYREWTSMVSGLGDTLSQKERLKRQISLWNNLSQNNENTMILGDANVCATSWNDENFGQKELSSMIQNYLLRSSSHQMISQPTHLNGSCIDHLYTNCPEKICDIKVTSVGNSDHMGICAKKLSKYPSSRPKTLKKQSYKNFDTGDFLTEVYNSNIKEEVIKHNTINDAADTFEKEFKQILDKHAPTRTIIIKKKCAPYISEETK